MYTIKYYGTSEKDPCFTDKQFEDTPLYLISITPENQDKEVVYNAFLNYAEETDMFEWCDNEPDDDTNEYVREYNDLSMAVHTFFNSMPDDEFKAMFARPILPSTMVWFTVERTED